MGRYQTSLGPDFAETIMPNLDFKITVFMENEQAIPELRARIANLSPAFEAIYGEWVELNQQKFELSVGRERSGAQVFGEEWAAVTPEYYKEKHSEGTPKVTGKMKQAGSFGIRSGIGFPDWLLVRTGALRAAMVNPDALFHQFNDQMATFGMPVDDFLSNLVMWQSGPRQKNRFVVFLGSADDKMILRILQDYFQLGSNFSNIRLSQGMAAVGYAPVDALGMEAGFEEPGL